MLRFENYFCCLLNGYFIFCSYVLLSCFYLFDNMSTCLLRDSAIREPWRTCTEIRESRALCREQRVSVSCLLCAMVPGRKAALAASGKGSVSSERVRPVVLTSFFWRRERAE